MAKFNIEVELDWIDNEEDGISIDDEIRAAVVSGVKNELLKKATTEAVVAVEKEIAERTKQAGEIIQVKVDEFVESICSEKITNIKIPVKESTWSSKYKMVPISEFIGNRYADFLNKKVYDDNGNVAKYDRDRKVSINEYFINKYLQNNLVNQISEMIKKAKEEAEEMVLKTLEQNLKDQLAADTIKRLNIPKLLENLQQKAIDFESKENDVYLKKEGRVNYGK